MKGKADMLKQENSFWNNLFLCIQGRLVHLEMIQDILWYSIPLFDTNFTNFMKFGLNE